MDVSNQAVDAKTQSHAEREALPLHRRWGPSLLAFCCLSAAASASAQGVYPGELSKDGYKLPGGFEPVVQLRTYYFDTENLNGTPSAAWAVGGWAGLRSPWFGNWFQFGLVGYTSQKLYGPDDKDGTKLLEPGQNPITVLGEAYAAARVFDQTLTAYRQLINRPWINPQDNRMVPNTFEAYTLTGRARDVSYTGGYITKIKRRDLESFDWMSDAAGATGDHKGVLYAGGTWDFAKNGYVRMDEQYAYDVFNTFYFDAKLPFVLDAQTLLTLDFQYTNQKSVGEAMIGSFSTYATGFQAAITRGPFGGQLYYTQTGKGFDTQNPFGDNASYLNLMQVAFNGAGEKAWGIGGSVGFAGFGAPGLTVGAVYAAGRDRIDARTGASIGNREETNLRVDYAFAKGTVLDGLTLGLRGSWLHQDGSLQTAPQLRAFANYAVRF